MYFENVLVQQVNTQKGSETTGRTVKKVDIIDPKGDKGVCLLFLCGWAQGRWKMNNQGGCCKHKAHMLCVNQVAVMPMMVTGGTTPLVAHVVRASPAGVGTTLTERRGTGKLGRRRKEDRRGARLNFSRG